MIHIDILGQNFPKCVCKTFVFFLTAPKKPSSAKNVGNHFMLHASFRNKNFSLKKTCFTVFGCRNFCVRIVVILITTTHMLQSTQHAVLHSVGAQQLPENLNWQILTLCEFLQHTPIYRFLCGLTMICSQGLFLKGLIFNRSWKFYHSGKNKLFYFYSILTLTCDHQTARTFSGNMI